MKARLPQTKSRQRDYSKKYYKIPEDTERFKDLYAAYKYAIEMGLSSARVEEIFKGLSVEGNVDIYTDGTIRLADTKRNRLIAANCIKKKTRGVSDGEFEISQTSKLGRFLAALLPKKPRCWRDCYHFFTQICSDCTDIFLIYEREKWFFICNEDCLEKVNSFHFWYREFSKGVQYETYDDEAEDFASFSKALDEIRANTDENDKLEAISAKDYCRYREKKKDGLIRIKKEWGERLEKITFKVTETIEKNSNSTYLFEVISREETPEQNSVDYKE